MRPCQRYTTARRKAHRMFYHACRAGGCSIPEATLLYIGVRIGDVWPLVPAWSPLIAAPERSLYEKTPTDQRIEADFRLIAQQVLAQPERDAIAPKGTDGNATRQNAG